MNMTTRRRLALTAAGTLALGLFAGWMVFIRWSPPGRPRCQIRVSTVGARHATFELSNIGQHSVFVLGVYAMENHSGEWRTELMPKIAKTLNTNLMGVVPLG